MAGTAIADGYVNATGVIKHTIDEGIYSRPELPIEIVPLLTSKTATKNASPLLWRFRARSRRSA